MYRRLCRRLSGFRSLGMVIIIFYIVNIAVFAAITIYPSLIEWLWLSADRPWGIMTSAFSHAELEHLASNLEGFVLATWLFVLVNMTNPRGIRRRRSRVFIWVVFIAGIGANVIEYPLALLNPGDSSWGASGIVYGGLGVFLASALQSVHEFVNIIRRRERRHIMNSVVSIILLIAFLAFIALDTAGFLNVGPGIDVLAHGIGFLLGLAGFTIYMYYERMRALLKKPSKGKSRRAW